MLGGVWEWFGTEVGLNGFCLEGFSRLNFKTGKSELRVRQPPSIIQQLPSSREQVTSCEWYQLSCRDRPHDQNPGFLSASCCWPIVPILPGQLHPSDFDKHQFGAHPPDQHSSGINIFNTPFPTHYPRHRRLQNVRKLLSRLEPGFAVV